MTALEQSNSLADLAARIQREHSACCSCLERGLAHAVAAGRLLIEAKGQIPHGSWLPWLRDNVQIPLRTAQRYMQVAPYAAESKNDKLAHLPGDAVAALAPPRPPDEAESEEEIFAWAQRLLDAPFTPDDVDSLVVRGADWFQTKLMHQAGVPAVANYCLSMREDDLNTLRLCPYEELIDACRALAPLAQGDRALKIDAPDMQSMWRVITYLDNEAKWLLGNLLREIEHRCSRDTERKQQADADEWDEIHCEMMKRLEVKRAALNQPDIHGGST
jgi:hypothetical protein